ncbi:unnamed protein product [Spirodela intermedia]|uniref:Uncharacterized protein n=1 Tax=Spirodela intermedia TaxID=51605 RepID=A0A7I8IHK7_SPIIN|nr:unnamed protein product [Spirodela intermedia]CAA6656563.1 unnamed protein product [Spirodela intermedia]
MGTSMPNISINIMLAKHPLVDSRVEDSKSMNSDADFFSKIGSLWIQVIDLVIVRITTMLKNLPFPHPNLIHK